MGRVYAVRPGAGELPGTGMRVIPGFGRGTEAYLSHVTRVELDDDADEGPATVTVLATDTRGGNVLDPDTRAAARATFRAWVKVVPKPRPADTPVVAGPATPLAGVAGG